MKEQSREFDPLQIVDMTDSNPKKRLLVATHHLPIVAICHNLKNNSKTYSSLPRSIAKKIGEKINLNSEPLVPFWEIQKRSGHTALFSGIKALEETMDVVHVGWTGQLLDETKEQIHDAIDPALINNLVQKIGPKYVPVFLDEETARGHYYGYCKSHLWPIFHYQIWEKATRDTPSWIQYIKVNQKFADAIVNIWQPKDISKFKSWLVLKL